MRVPKGLDVQIGGGAADQTEERRGTMIAAHHPKGGEVQRCHAAAVKSVFSEIT